MAKRVPNNEREPVDFAKVSRGAILTAVARWWLRQRGIPAVAILVAIPLTVALLLTIVRTQPALQEQYPLLLLLASHSAAWIFAGSLIVYSCLLAIALVLLRDRGTVDAVGAFRPGAMVGVRLVNGSADAGSRRAERKALAELVDGFNPPGPLNPNRTDEPATWLKAMGNGFAVYIEGRSDELTVQTCVRALATGLSLAQRAADLGIRLGVAMQAARDISYQTVGASMEWGGRPWDGFQHLIDLAGDGHFLIDDATVNELVEHAVLEATGKPTAIAGDAVSLYAALEDADSDERCKSALVFDNPSGRYQMDAGSACNGDHLYNVHSFQLLDRDGRIRIGSAGSPMSVVRLQRRRLLADPDNEFVRHLVEADEVRIVGLTHRGLEGYLEIALEKRREGRRPSEDVFWDRLDIVFPGESTVASVIESRSGEDRLDEWKSSRFEVVRFLEGDGIPPRWQCLQSDGYFTFTGNLFRHNDDQRSDVARISPILEGDQRGASYLTVLEGAPMFDQIAKTFEVLSAGAKSIAEWDVHVDITDDMPRYRGVARRPDVEHIGSGVPVVIVILHGPHQGRRHLYLQLRTRFNSSDNYDTFSNISGRIAVDDMVPPDELEDCRRLIEDVLRSLPGRTQLEAATSVSQTLENRFGWTGMVLADEVWVRTAQREVAEELGLAVDIDRFVMRKEFPLAGGSNRYFRLLSLELTEDDIDTIQRQRPHASIRPLTLGAFDTIACDPRKLNLALGRRPDLFRAIFVELGIAER